VLAAIFEENETAVIERAKTGDSAAFEQIILEYRSRLTDLIYYLYGDENLAEDAAQMAFIKAWRHLPEFQSGRSFQSWLFKIAINAAIDHLRREKPRVDIDAIMDLSLNEHIEDRIENGERWVVIRQAVAELPDSSRSVLILKEFEGLRYQEIADVLDIPLGTVMSRLNYARKILAAKLTAYMEDV
jgi:RNA polymerase sigma-70 factor (ECF subfamily)